MSKFQAWAIEMLGGIVPADVENVVPDIKAKATAQVAGATMNIKGVSDDIAEVEARLATLRKEKQEHELVEQAASNILRHVH